MKFSLIHANRLRRLVRHLRRGKLAHKRFDFSIVNADHTGKGVFDHCGTAGCALGEFHWLFPKHFRNKFWCGVEDAERFLAINTAEARHLFLPNWQFEGSKTLAPNSTPAEVAENMIAFLKLKGFDYND